MKKVFYEPTPSTELDLLHEKAMRLALLTRFIEQVGLKEEAEKFIDSMSEAKQLEN